MARFRLVCKFTKCFMLSSFIVKPFLNRKDDRETKQYPKRIKLPIRALIIKPTKERANINNNAVSHFGIADFETVEGLFLFVSLIFCCVFTSVSRFSTVLGLTAFDDNSF